jgi:hypothetical protein
MQKLHGFFDRFSLQGHECAIYAGHEGSELSNRLLSRIKQEAIMTRDELNRELRMHSATWQSVVLVYGILVGTLVLSAMAITA